MACGALLPLASCVRVFASRHEDGPNCDRKSKGQCIIQTSANASAPASWGTALNLTLPTNPPSARFDWTNRGEAGRFFRSVEK